MGNPTGNRSCSERWLPFHWLCPHLSEWGRDWRGTAEMLPGGCGQARRHLCYIKAMV